MRQSKTLKICANHLAPDDTQKSHRLRHRMHKSSESSHRTMSKSLSSDSQSKGSVSTPRGSTVDLSKLEIAALWRYWRQLLLDSNGRVAGHCGVCSGCKETEDYVQMTWREMERALHSVVYADTDFLLVAFRRFTFGIT
ncbi:uncharacterized protein LOC126726269 isoform X2 [Quercus robur]|uniref:uncharacterized protein LOC126726269 isoform X2 n=1 Tax=Quercus robur TaxID=38942 RepID=UPI00216200B6|nr:uncharacterized protein LOC126726269 isoform X2 [Quercus robur]